MTELYIISFFFSSFLFIVVIWIAKTGAYPTTTLAVLPTRASPLGKRNCVKNIIIIIVYSYKYLTHSLDHKSSLTTTWPIFSRFYLAKLAKKNCLLFRKIEIDRHVYITDDQACLVQISKR